MLLTYLCSCLIIIAYIEFTYIQVSKYIFAHQRLKLAKCNRLIQMAYLEEYCNRRTFKGKLYGRSLYTDIRGVPIAKEKLSCLYPSLFFDITK